jgi:hypothetical protein
MSFVRVLSNSSSKAAAYCACVCRNFVLILLKVVEGFVFFLVAFKFFRAAIASGLVILRAFSAPLPKRVVLSAFARRMRL